jgi:hypothetical protein
LWLLIEKITGTTNFAGKYKEYNNNLSISISEVLDKIKELEEYYKVQCEGEPQIIPPPCPEEPMDIPCLPDEETLAQGGVNVLHTNLDSYVNL